jgi:poly(3-hydroxybutyrate) depolymerase
LIGNGLGFGQPVITQQPQSYTNIAGSTATFSMLATGTPPLGYQWQKDTGSLDFSDLTDATNASLVLTNLQLNDAVDYRVVVSNLEGAATSAVAHLYVITLPRIGTQPSDGAVARNATFTFRVGATGTSPLSWQWRQDDIDLPSATNNTLLLRQLQLTNAGGYTVVVTNLAGAVTSRVAQLSVADGWIFTNAQGTRLPYRLFLPPKYDSAVKYPLVLFWHGAGEVGTDNLLQLKDNGEFSFLTASNVARFPCFFLAPQMPHFPNSAGEANGFFDWATNLLDFLEKQYSIDPDRLYVTGLSMGGFSTWAMLARYPELLAAAIPMSGSWYWNSSTDFLRSLHVPVWNFHAADDSTVPVNGSDSAVASLRGAGASVIYTRYQSGGHPIWPVGYSTPALMDWIMAQKRGAASVTEPLVSITSPTSGAPFWTGATYLDLAGTATALGQPITIVNWRDTANARSGTASGTNTWSVASIPLLSDRTNTIVVIATTTSWARANGGNTTFNETLAVIQSSLRAMLSFQGTNVLLTWTGGGGPYRVQYSTNLTTGEWADLFPNATPPVILPFLPDTKATFYRIVGQ